jgi:hypothetical protein
VINMKPERIAPRLRSHATAHAARSTPMMLLLLLIGPHLIELSPVGTRGNLFAWRWESGAVLVVWAAEA